MSGLLETSKKPRGPLADAAERFDRVAQVVKEQQLSETRSGQRVALSETYSASPDEAWAKKFMTQAIGPVVADAAAPALPALPPFLARAQVTQDFAAVPKAPAQSLASASSLRPGGDLRAAAGMRAESNSVASVARRQRSWLAWLLLGR